MRFETFDTAVAKAQLRPDTMSCVGAAGLNGADLHHHRERPRHARYCAPHAATRKQAWELGCPIVCEREAANRSRTAALTSS